MDVQFFKHHLLKDYFFPVTAFSCLSKIRKFKLMYNHRKHIGGRLLGMMEIVVMVHFIYMSKLKLYALNLYASLYVNYASLKL